MTGLFPARKCDLKMPLRFIGAAVLTLFLAAKRGLFFGPSLLKNVKATVPFEAHRPAVFIFLIVLLWAWAFAGFIPALRRRGGDSAGVVFRGRVSAVITFVLMLVNACISFYVIELINNYYILNMKTRYVVLGIGITYVIYIVLAFAFNYVHAGMTAGNILFLLWAAVNYFVQQFRGIPFQWIDFGSARTAMSVSGNYKYVMTWQIAGGITVTCVVIGLWWDLKPGKLMSGLRGRIATGIISLGLLAAFSGVIFHTDFLKNTGIWLRDWQPWYTYRLFGMESGFLAFAKASFPEAPEGYSAEEVRRIIDNSENAASELKVPGGDVPENLIVIMNESFSDLTVYPGFKASEDVISGFHQLTENTQKGRLLVSVKGGTTANTEYEFLTGNSCVLSPTTVVYNSFIKQDQFSLARVLSAQGYKAVAMHPYGPYGWNRNAVYPRMGFDEFYHIKNAYGDAEKVRSFVGDRSDYAEIRKQLESKKDGEKLFIFNITMQNHSQYRTENFKSTVKVEGFNGKNKGQAEQYCTLLKMSDEAIMEFLEYLKTLDQKTMVLFFGDHQPEIGDDFWEYCQGGDTDSWTFEEQQRAFETCFFLWANYDIPEAEGLTLSANYLSAYLLSQTDLARSGYEDYLLMMRGAYPAMNSFGYITPDGTHHQWGEKDADAEAEEKLRQYKCLIYNELTGGEARDAGFFG